MLFTLVSVYKAVLCIQSEYIYRPHSHDLGIFPIVESVRDDYNFQPLIL